MCAQQRARLQVEALAGIGCSKSGPTAPSPVPPRRWQFGAMTLDPVRAVELDTDRLSALAEADPAMGYRLALGLFEAVLARLQNTRVRLLDLYGSPRER